MKGRGGRGGVKGHRFFFLLLILECVQVEGSVQETPQLHQVSVFVSCGRGCGWLSAGVPGGEERGEESGRQRERDREIEIIKKKQKQIQLSMCPGLC